MIPGGQAHINARDAAVKSIDELANYFKVNYSFSFLISLLLRLT